MFQKTLFGQLSKYFQFPRNGEDDQLAAAKGGFLKSIEEYFEFKQELIWLNIISIAILHIVSVYYFFACLSEYPLSLWIYTISIIILSGIGVTGGAHRYWSHKAYKATLPFQVFLLFCFTMAGQNSLYDWVRDHRVHHKFSETDADPHNAKRGFFFSHVGWLMMKKHQEVYDKGSKLDMADIADDKLLAWHRRNFIPLKIIIAFVIPTCIPPLLWNESWRLSFIAICLLRYTFVLNSTWLVNSVAHIWGTKPYDKSISPTQSLFVAILALGEGWHNYHHVFPWDYKAAEIGPYRTNFTTLVLDLASKFGLVYDLKEPSKEMIQEVSRKRGDGSWEEYYPQSEHIAKDKNS